MIKQYYKYIVMGATIFFLSMPMALPAKADPPVDCKQHKLPELMAQAEKGINRSRVVLHFEAELLRALNRNNMILAIQTCLSNKYGVRR